MNNRFRITVFFVLVMVGVSLRLICRDIPNFAPVAALSLFAGFYFRSLWVAALLTCAVLGISNLELGGYDSWAITLAVYASLILPALLGKLFLARNDGEVSFLRMTSFAFFGSVLFFFVTNYAAWVQWYPKTAEGFWACYVAAIPFFRMTLAGDLFFCYSFFTGYALILRVASLPRTVRIGGQSVVGDYALLGKV